jgi:hypothetical protein
MSPKPVKKKGQVPDSPSDAWPAGQGTTPTTTEELEATITDLRYQLANALNRAQLAEGKLASIREIAR